MTNLPHADCLYKMNNLFILQLLIALTTSLFVTLEGLRWAQHGLCLHCDARQTAPGDCYKSEWERLKSVVQWTFPGDFLNMLLHRTALVVCQQSHCTAFWLCFSADLGSYMPKLSTLISLGMNQ